MISTTTTIIPTTTTTTTKAPTTTTTTTSTTPTPIVDRPFYNYDESGEPIVAFRDPADGTEFGVWWWWADDAYNATIRDKYLNFLEKQHVSEIYFYGYYDMSDRPTKLRDFVKAANAKGMIVSLIYDDNDTIMGSWNSIKSICAEYNSYLAKYPGLKMGGYHFDVEHESVQDFAKNLVSKFPQAKEAGVRISMDVNCEMLLDKVNQVDKDGNVLMTGNIYELICANADTICLMAYKDTFSAIWSLGANAFAAAQKYNCKCVFGIETGDYSSGNPPHKETFNKPGDEFAQEDKETAYTELGKIYFELSKKCAGTNYGIAIHQHEDWYNLAKAADKA